MLRLEFTSSNDVIPLRQLTLFMSKDWSLSLSSGGDHMLPYTWKYGVFCNGYKESKRVREVL